MSRVLLDFTNEDVKSVEELREEDEARTGRGRCIGCGKFLRDHARWNQCADCDTRYPGEAP